MLIHGKEKFIFFNYVTVCVALRCDFISPCLLLCYYELTLLPADIPIKFLVRPLPLV